MINTQKKAQCKQLFSRRENKHYAPAPLPQQYRSTGCFPDNHASEPSQPFAGTPPGKRLSSIMAITRIISAWLLMSFWQRKDILRSFEYRRIKINHILKLNQSCLMNLSPRHISVSESTITISLSITNCLKKNAVSSGNVIVIRFASFS